MNKNASNEIQIHKSLRHGEKNKKWFNVQLEDQLCVRVVAANEFGFVRLDRLPYDDEICRFLCLCERERTIEE